MLTHECEIVVSQPMSLEDLNPVLRGIYLRQTVCSSQEDVEGKVTGRLVEYLITITVSCTASIQR